MFVGVALAVLLFIVCYVISILMNDPSVCSSGHETLHYVAKRSFFHPSGQRHMFFSELPLISIITFIHIP